MAPHASPSPRSTSARRARICLQAAEIANEGITLEYESGNQRTTLEVIQSRTLLLEARTSYANAQKDFAIAQFNLLASIGDLFLENIR